MYISEYMLLYLLNAKTDIKLLITIVFCKQDYYKKMSNKKKPLIHNQKNLMLNQRKKVQFLLLKTLKKPLKKPQFKLNINSKKTLNQFL